MIKLGKNLTSGLGLIIDYDLAVGKNFNSKAHEGKDHIYFNIEGGDIADTKTPTYDFKETVGRTISYAGYNNTSSRTISFSAIFVSDTDGKKDVYDSVNFLRSFVYPNYTKGYIAPPSRIIFQYGKFIKIFGIITSAEPTWTLLQDVDQFPIKAVVSVGIQEVASPDGTVNIDQNMMRQGKFPPLFR